MSSSVGPGAAHPLECVSAPTGSTREIEQETCLLSDLPQNMTRQETLKQCSALLLRDSQPPSLHAGDCVPPGSRQLSWVSEPAHTYRTLHRLSWSAWWFTLFSTYHDSRNLWALLKGFACSEHFPGSGITFILSWNLLPPPPRPDQRYIFWAWDWSPLRLVGCGDSLSNWQRSESPVH